MFAKRGSTVIEPLEVKVQEGFHVNSNKPLDEFLIPLKLSWKGPLVTRQIMYPAPEKAAVGDQTLNVFTGMFTVKTEFAVPANAEPGLALVQGTLHYQACDSVSCKRPADLAVQVPVSIE